MLSKPTFYLSAFVSSGFLLNQNKSNSRQQSSRETSA
uniref:Uncharacterized protein n=1 Tax=Populus trichocarpa TaxID=3694 RepID=A9P8P6_POPTR|nr:unknown [Populus trichocarpa]